MYCYRRQGRSEVRVLSKFQQVTVTRPGRSSQHRAQSRGGPVVPLTASRGLSSLRRAREAGALV